MGETKNERGTKWNFFLTFGSGSGATTTLLPYTRQEQGERHNSLAEGHPLADLYWPALRSMDDI